MLKLSPLEILDAGSELVKLCDLKHAPYPYGVPTFAPKGWKERGIISQDEYNRKFTESLSMIRTLVKKVPKICVAGGGAAWPLHEKQQWVNSDVDIFIHGIDNEDEGWKKVEEIYEACCELQGGNINVVVTMQRVSTFYAGDLKVQIILQIHPDIASILKGFDLGCCAVAYDGDTTYFTPLGAYCSAHRLNIIDPRVAHVNYAPRIMKYFDRGFALAAPGMRSAWQSSLAVDDFEIVMPGLILEIIHPCECRPPLVENSYLAYASISLGGDVKPCPKISNSDYTREEIIAGRSSNLQRHNLRVMMRGDSKNYIKYNLNHGFTLRESIMTLPWLNASIDQEISGILTYINTYGDNMSVTVDLGILKEVFAMTDSEIRNFCGKVAALNAENPRARIDCKKAMEPFRSRIIDVWSAAENKIDWWAPPPSTNNQWYPNAMTDKEWYGALATEESQPTEETLLSEKTQLQPSHHERLIATYELIAHSAICNTTSICSICQEEVVHGGVGVIILNCGHAFHWADEKGCDGMHLWLKGLEPRNKTCPVCRHHVGVKPSIAKKVVPVAASVPIELVL